MKIFATLMLALLAGCSGSEPTELNAELRKELLQMKEADQEIRSYVAEKVPMGGSLDPAVAARWDSIDTANTARLKKIIDEYGWPGHDLVGEDGAGAAFLLAQHADKDPAFQKRVLPLLKVAVQAGQASPKSLAYLTDRVRVKEKQPQVYGTQINWSTGRPVPYPIEDSVNVDSRRLEVGLGPLAEYVESMNH